MTSSSGPSVPAPSNAPINQHRISTTLLGLVLPLGILATACAIAMSWRADLPDLVATHWGSDGADDFSSLSGATVLPAVVAAVVVTSLWALAATSGRAAPTRRILIATNVWTAAFISVLILGSLNAQRGLVDAQDVGGIGAVMALAFVTASVAATAVAFVTPRGGATPANAAPPSSAPRIPLAPGERAAWVGTTSSRTGALIGGVAVVGSAILAFTSGDLWLLGLPIILAITFAAMFHYTVRVDATGLSVRSLLGVPRTHLPLDEIESAQVGVVRALGEYGGWGWRVGRDGSTGVIMRSGEALEVISTGERMFVITIEDAAAAAALLNTLADRSRS